MLLSRIVWLDRILALVIPIRGIRRHLGAYSRGRVAARSAGGYSSWFLSVLQQGPHGWVASWLALVVVPVAVTEDDGLEVFGAVVFFDAEHEGDHVVVEVEEADIKCLGGHHWLLWWLVRVLVAAW